MKYLVCIFLIQLFISHSNSFAQSGFLDSTFNNTGILPITIGPNNNSTDQANAVALQTDGKIIIAGSTWTGTTTNFALARCNTDGTLDNSFGDKGIVTTSVGGASEIKSIAIQPDGKIIAVGIPRSNLNHGFLLARYKPDGSLDSSFGTDGKVITLISGDFDGAQSVIVQTNGKIVVGGYGGFNQNQAFALARYNKNGTLDTSFSEDGIQTTSFNNARDYVTSLALQQDGKIIAAGFTVINEIPNFALARYNTDGSLDNTFGLEGKLISGLNNLGSEAWSLAIQNNGKIIVGGSFGSTDDSNFGLIRYNIDGSIDKSFGINGIAITDVDSSDEIRAIAIRPNGKIVAAGNSISSFGGIFSIAQYNSDGLIDNTFGNNGIITTPTKGGGGELKGLSLQADGKIVVSGFDYYGPATNYDFVLVRYLSDLNVGVVEFNSLNSSIQIYPNPINSEASINYTLTKNENLSLRLVDMKGHIIQTFFSNQYRSAGENKESIHFDSSIITGMYILEFSNGKGRTSLRIVKD